MSVKNTTDKFKRQPAEWENSTIYNRQEVGIHIQRTFANQ